MHHDHRHTVNLFRLVLCFALVSAVVACAESAPLAPTATRPQSTPAPTEARSATVLPSATPTPPTGASLALVVSESIQGIPGYNRRNVHTPPA